MNSARMLKTPRPLFNENLFEFYPQAAVPLVDGVTTQTPRARSPSAASPMKPASALRPHPRKTGGVCAGVFWLDGSRGFFLGMGHVKGESGCSVWPAERQKPGCPGWESNWAYGGTPGNHGWRADAERCASFWTAPVRWRFGCRSKLSRASGSKATRRPTKSGSGLPQSKTRSRPRKRQSEDASPEMSQEL